MYKRWVIQIIGPSDVIDQPDEFTALREANNINKLLLQIDGSENTPYLIAVVKDANSEDV